MKLNRDVLITAIIRHQRCFLQLLDFIDSNGGANEVPESLYLQLFQGDISKDADENTVNQLAMDTLVENGVFIYNNRATGMLTIERVIIDLLRFIDVKRQRELTHSDFEVMRTQFHQATEQVTRSELSSENYNESMHSLHQVISEIHAKVRQNVDALQAQVGKIADRYKSYQEQAASEHVIALYDDITKLYQRYVLPCLEFINPSMTMKGTHTFSQNMDIIINYHGREHTDYDTAHRMGYRRTAITSYYKDIKELARKLQLYSKYLDTDRRQFLAIEHAYTSLMESVIPLRHGKRRNRLLSKDAEVFQRFNTFPGLRSHRGAFSPRFNWSNSKTPLRVAEFLRSRTAASPPKQAPRLQPVAAAPDPELMRQQEISMFLNEQPLAIESDDIFRDLHQLLSENLANYSLVDTLFGYHTYLAVTEISPAYPGTRNRLEDDTYYFDYLVPITVTQSEAAHV